jgi:hypothetical protein
LGTVHDAMSFRGRWWWPTGRSGFLRALGPVRRLFLWALLCCRVISGGRFSP